MHSAGGREGTLNFLGVGILIFSLLRSQCKIAKPYDNPFWGELAMSRKRERERKKERREKNAIYSGHLRLRQQQRAAHALRLDQLLFSSWFGIWKIVGVQQESKTKIEFDL
jgi:hypothetical protein